MLRRDSGRPDGATCEDFKDRCWQVNAHLLRRLCPWTCGCGDRRSGQFLAGGYNGCPRSLCESHLRHSLKELECRDPPAEELRKIPAWKIVTKQIVQFYASVLDRDVTWGQQFWEEGCGALDKFPKDRFCNPYHQLIGSMHAWCPIKCGCLKRPHDSIYEVSCPKKCKEMKQEDVD